MKTWLMDTGRLVALLVGSDSQHEWTVAQTKHAPATVLTCDAVISEALFLLKRAKHNTDDLFALLDAGFCTAALIFTMNRRVRELMKCYKNLPLSFADACLERMAEHHEDACIWTLDRDFQVYRKHGRQSLSIIAPW